MPLSGLIGKDGTSYPLDEALALCEKGDERFPYPYPLLAGIVAKQNDRPADMISATSILHCLRAEFLKRHENYSAHVEGLYPAFRGTLFHALMEKYAPPNARIEERHTRTHRGIEISGQFDSLLTWENPADDQKRFTLQDWKTTNSLPKYGAYSSHVQQLNIYRWLLGLPADDVRIEVWYFAMDGFVRTVLKDGSGKSGVTQIWSDAQVEAFLDDRLVKLKASLMTKMPLPYREVTPEEKWECEYCPVRSLCDRLSMDEAYQLFRRRAGLAPNVDVDAAESAVWADVVEAVRARIIPDDTPKRGRGRPRKETRDAS